MKVRRTLPYVSLIALLVLSFGACKDGDAPESKTPESRESSSGQDDYPKFSYLRGLSERELAPDRFLGRSFNLIKHTNNDRDGFAEWDILDKARLTADNPWSPFGRPVDPEAYAPEQIERDENPKDPYIRTYSILNSRSYSDSLTISVGAEYKPVTLGYTNKRYTSSETASYIYRSILGYKYLSESYDIRDVSDFEFYLHKRFVRDLKKLTAAELVEKYGTHLVTSYTTGAFQDLAISASKNSFTEGDVAKIHAALWSDKGTLSHEVQRKLTNSQSKIGVTYIQSGSDYIPPQSLLLPTILFDGSKEIAPIDHKSFAEQIRMNARSSFFALKGDNPLIPSLISDLPLKVKYFSGILDLIRPQGVGGTMYVFSDPDTYGIVDYHSEYLDVIMPRYESGQVYIFIGPNAYRTFDETGRSMHRWYAQLNESGLWTFQSLKSSKYLCRDFALRTKAEDTENLRFWGLNPAIPTAELNQYSLANLFVRKSRGVAQ